MSDTNKLGTNIEDVLSSIKGLMKDNETLDLTDVVNDSVDDDIVKTIGVIDSKEILALIEKNDKNLTDPNIESSKINGIKTQISDKIDKAIHAAVKEIIETKVTSWLQDNMPNLLENTIKTEVRKWLKDIT